VARYLIDTSALIDFSKGREPARARILALIRDDNAVGVCPINITEFFAGIPSEQRSQWDWFFASLTVWNISSEASLRAGYDRYDYGRRGHTLATTDALVAAVAREQRATILTDNPKDFPMSDIVVQSVRD
jgi:predicted nucleic acid-binding protein